MSAKPFEQANTARALGLWAQVHGGVQLRMCLEDLVESLANLIESVEGSCVGVAKSSPSKDILLAWLETQEDVAPQFWGEL